MKKKILVGVVAVAIVAVAVVNRDFGSGKRDDLSAVHLANIEALAQGEDNNSDPKTCYKTITYQKYQEVFYCGTCSWVKDSAPSWVSGSSTCK